MTDNTVLEKMRGAFPNTLKVTTTDNTFRFGTGANIWVRHSNDNLARILVDKVSNLPNGGELEHYLRSRDVKIHRTKTKAEYLVDPEHIGAVIRILKR